MMNAPASQYAKADTFRVLPNSKWFLAAYARDVWGRLDTCKSCVTSVFGEILKIDSTKKVLKKLAGDAKQSATWVTNVGNEYGVILQSVATSSEANEALLPMAKCLVERYASANVPPPRLLYTDRDCCSLNGLSRFRRLFSSWDSLEIRLDIWHFMRRIASGCASESHPLYGSFMSQLSGCIFEWDKHDYQELLGAKKEELQSKLLSPSNEAASKAITKEELARHCPRRTRGIEVTQTCIEKLILAYTGCTDTLGYRFLRTKYPRFIRNKSDILPVFKILTILASILKLAPPKREEDCCHCLDVLEEVLHWSPSIVIYKLLFLEQVQML